MTASVAIVSSRLRHTHFVRARRLVRMDDWDDWDDFGEGDRLVPKRGYSYGKYNNPFRKDTQKRLRVVMLQLYYSSATAPYHCVTFFLAGVLLLTSLGFETPLRSRPRVVLLLEVHTHSVYPATMGRSAEAVFPGGTDVKLGTCRPQKQPLRASFGRRRRASLSQRRCQSAVGATAGRCRLAGSSVR